MQCNACVITTFKNILYVNARSMCVCVHINKEKAERKFLVGEFSTYKDKAELKIMLLLSSNNTTTSVVRMLQKAREMYAKLLW